MKLINVLLKILIIAVLHLAIINLLPYPLNHLNIIILTIIWVVLTAKQDHNIWVVVGLAFFAELFANSLFGANLISITLTLIVVYWILRNILTNRTVYIIALSTFLAIIIYRIFYIISLVIFSTITQTAITINKEIILDIGWELILTVIASIFYYFFTRKRMYIKKY